MDNASDKRLRLFINKSFRRFGTFSSNNKHASDGNKHTDAKLIADKRADNVVNGRKNLVVLLSNKDDKDHCIIDLVKRMC